MAKYNLVCKHNDIIFSIIKTGNLESIDNYIYNLKINDIQNLFENINKSGQYDEINGKINFKITSEQKGIKERPILFTPEIDLIKKDNEILKYRLLKKILLDKEFRSLFIEKIIYPRLKANSKIAIKANDFINFNRYFFNTITPYNKSKLEEDYEKVFSDFYYSLICIKRKHNDLKKNADGISELREVEQILDTNYSEKRKLVELVLSYENKLPLNFIEQAKIDEFEELMIHDQNSDIDRIKNYEFDDELIDTYYNYNNDYNGLHSTVKKLKKEKKSKYYQTSFFDEI